MIFVERQRMIFFNKIAKISKINNIFSRSISPPYIHNIKYIIHTQKPNKYITTFSSCKISLPSKHTTLFRRCCFDVQTTLYQRQNDVVWLLGNCFKFNNDRIIYVNETNNFHLIIKCLKEKMKSKALFMRDQNNKCKWELFHWENRRKSLDGTTNPPTVEELLLANLEWTQSGNWFCRLSKLDECSNQQFISK